jgi:hypothetical protein
MIQKISHLAWLPLLLFISTTLFFNIYTPTAQADHRKVVCEGDGPGGVLLPHEHEGNPSQHCTNMNGGEQTPYIKLLYRYDCADGRVIYDERFMDGGTDIICDQSPTGTSTPGDTTPGDNNNPGGQTNGSDQPKFVKNDCNGPAIQAGLPEDDPNHCGILDFIQILINVLSALVGLVVVGSIIYAGIQYSTAGSDPQKTAEAKNRIRNAIIAFIFFIFTYALLNYLIPGGVIQ